MGLLDKFVKQFANIGNVFNDISKSGFLGAIRSGISNWWKGFTGSGATDRDKEINAMNMQNVREQASAEVEGYTKAGINPALMFGSGTSTAPQASSSGVSGNMSELLQALMIPAQLRQMNAQTDYIKADTAKTRVDTLKSGKESERIGIDIEEAKTRIEGLKIDNQQKAVLLSYLDRMQQAELRIKGLSADKLSAEVDEVKQHIHNLSAEECATYLSMLETMEKLDVMATQKTLNTEQANYYAKLAHNVSKQSELLDKQITNFDLITVIGSTSMSIGFGPFKGSDSHPVTLSELKKLLEFEGESKTDQEDGRSKKSWEQIKKEAEERFGPLE